MPLGRERLFAVLACLAACSAPERAELRGRSTPAEPEALPQVSLLNVPLPETLTIYPSPTATVGRIVPRSDEDHEWGHDTDEAEPVIFVSLEVVGKRHRVLYRGQDVWMEKVPRVRFMTPADFWTSQLAELVTWNGAIYDAVGGEARLSPAFAAAPRDELAEEASSSLPPGFARVRQAIDVKDARYEGGEFWIRADLIDLQPCDGPIEEAKVLDTGWLRQSAAGRSNAVQYYPRGC